MCVIKNQNRLYYASSGCGGTLQGAKHTAEGKLRFLSGLDALGYSLVEVCFKQSLRYVVTASGMETVDGDAIGQTNSGA